MHFFISLSILFDQHQDGRKRVDPIGWLCPSSYAIGRTTVSDVTNATALDADPGKTLLFTEQVHG